MSEEDLINSIKRKIQLLEEHIELDNKCQTFFKNYNKVGFNCFSLTDQERSLLFSKVPQHLYDSLHTEIQDNLSHLYEMKMNSGRTVFGIVYNHIQYQLEQYKQVLIELEKKSN